MKTIAVTNQKGGVGKTTTSLLLHECLQIAGYKTLLIDADPQGNTSFCFNIDTKNEYTLYDLLARDVLHIKSKEPVTTATVIQHTDYGDVILSDELLSGLAQPLLLNGRRALQSALSEVEEQYDFCIIDTPPELGSFMISALIAADVALIPIKAEAFSISGLKMILSTIQSIRNDDNPKLEIGGILLTAFDQRNSLDREVQLSLNTGDLSEYVFTRPVRVCQEVKKAQNKQTPLSRLFPKSVALEDSAYITKELLERMECYG